MLAVNQMKCLLVQMTSSASTQVVVELSACKNPMVHGFMKEKWWKEMLVERGKRNFIHEIRKLLVTQDHDCLSMAWKNF